jgi:hypothetical protein
MKICQSIDIISGYVGKDTLERFSPRMTEMAEAGGRVRLLAGMAGKEGLAQTTLDVLLKLDNELRAASNGNGVFSFQQPVHAKVYITYGQDMAPISTFCGSSNFNFSNTNMECTAEVPNHQQTTDFVNTIFTAASLLDISAVPVKGSSRDPLASQQIPHLKKTSRNISPGNLKLSECIDLKALCRKNTIASLNLYHSSGRLSRSTNLYTPRPWYEVELTLGKDNYPGLPRNFLAITDDGYEIELQRRSGGPKGQPELGLKDLTSKGNRTILGRWIKGKLEESGALQKTGVIDESTFETYGTHLLKFYKISDGEFYMSFAP